MSTTTFPTKFLIVLLCGSNNKFLTATCTFWIFKQRFILLPPPLHEMDKEYQSFRMSSTRSWGFEVEVEETEVLPFSTIESITRIHWLGRRIVRKQLDIMPTNHYVQNQGKLRMQSRENGQKKRICDLETTISRSHISKLQIFLKNWFHSNWRPYLALTSGQKPKKSLEPFLRKISKCLILG